MGTVESADSGAGRELSAAQRAQLARALAERKKRAPIPRRDFEGPAPLSYPQELLWLLDQLAGGSWAYNAPDSQRIRGPLDVAALEAAMNAVVAANEILRTCYPMIDGTPMQVVLEPAAVQFEIVDCEATPEADLHELFESYCEVPFDLASDRSVRFRLFRLGPDDHVLITAMHHITVDGASRHALWAQIGDAYRQALAGTAPVLPEPAIQYADFAVWQRRSLEGGELAEQLQYWKANLAGAPELLALPSDRPRPPVQTYRGAHEPRLLDVESQDGLRALSQAEGATLFMATTAALAVLLYRHTGETDIVIGTPIASRNRVELENMIGYFANTLALRIDCSGDPTFREVLRRAKSTIVEAFARQEVPFGKVVVEVSPDRDLSRTPVFQVLTVFHNQGRAVPDLPNLSIEREVHERFWSKFDLTVGFGEHSYGLGTGWEYSTDLFDVATIHRMQDHLARLVSSIVADPDTRISQLEMVGRDELAQLDAWTATSQPLPASATLHSLFEDAARRTPDAIALIDGDEQLTFAQLDAHATRLADHVQASISATDTAVGICAERSAGFVIALLATLKAGGTCLPLDPDYPAERISAMLADASAPVVIASEACRPTLPPGNYRLIALDDRSAWLASECPPVTAQPDDLAYLVFTSGSTGQPRGVELTHRGLVNHALAAIDLFGIAPGDRVLQFCSVSFDISIEEIFPTLIAGATVVIRPETLPLGGPGLVEWLDQHRISVLDVPTAFWHEWTADLESMERAPHDALRLVIVGGEKASAASFTTWRNVAGGAVRWINTYGPSEASVVATAFEPAPGWLPAPGHDLPIGSPLPNCRIVILDAAGNRAPIGVPGELHIGGPGVARGYRDRPQLTSERFVNDPADPSAVLYRTGDIARWLADGKLEFGGRADRQVKIRGFRVEPGEIETTLAQHPEVSEVVVTVIAGPAGPQLVGYVVPKARHGELESSLREHVADRLPAYMVPAAFVVLDALPINANGKVDVRALPDPNWGRRDDAAFVAPRTPTETLIAAVWVDVLGVDRVGAHDHFFDLGGHSLLATRAISRIAATSGTSLTLREFVTSPTVAELAATLDAIAAVRDAAATTPSAPKLGRVDRGEFRVRGGAT